MKVVYEFFFAGNRTETFTLCFNPRNMLLEPLAGATPCNWTELAFNRCANCTLSPDAHRNCPAALNLSAVAPCFKDNYSYEEITVRVTANDRRIEKHCRLESGIASMMGLIMATSGCPVLDCFRPMAFTHLPFANEDETLLRAIATYLMAQYIRMIQGKTSDWNLSKVADIYHEVSKVNAAFSQRIRAIEGKDANVTAVVALDLFAQFSEMTLPDNWADQVQDYFTAYLR